MKDENLTPRSEIDGYVADEVWVRKSTCLTQTPDGNAVEGVTDKELKCGGEAVPEALADLIWHEGGIDVTDKGIKVVPNEEGELDDE